MLERLAQLLDFEVPAVICIEARKGLLHLGSLVGGAQVANSLRKLAQVQLAVGLVVVHAQHAPGLGGA